ncbi:serine/threonine-protein kinase [Kitasatospora phosalacinea]|uniref:serine/threonine-protein kinase n=1 Tax=Kitasatospora phosalacinea TaxID=2065 RepID=UPI0006921B6A|nr:serine/threonine-protein kinase [Kitasatospora phosalacinea]
MDENLIAGRYRLEHRLGSGGMGDVWLAHDSQLDRPVAIKFLALDRLRRHQGDRENLTQQIVGKFLREARAMARISSRYVVTVHDQGEENDRYHLVMERVDGGPLSKYMGEGTALTLEQTVRWAAQVCEGLADAHEVEVVHRDIKPDNIMITERGDVKLVDFGLARLLDTTETHSAGLTWMYASPERCKGQPGDHRSDLYSLGCVLYEMLTGRPPFGDRESAPYVIADMHVHAIPSAPQDVRPGIPEELNDLALHLLTKEPNSRPHDASTVARLIQQVKYVPAPTSGALTLTGAPHVNPDYVERIRELERHIRMLQMTHGYMAPVVVDARMQLAELTGESGDRRGAVALYEDLGGDCREDFGPFDTRALDAFEAMARWIATSG